MKKKFTKLAALALVSAMIFSGCGEKSNSGGNEGGDSSTAETNVEESSGSGEATTLNLWITPMWKGAFSADEEGADYDSFFKEAAKRYKEKNPNVDVKIEVIASEQRGEKLNTAMSTDSLPDIFFENSFAMQEYVHKGAILPIDDIIDEDTKSDISPEIMDNVMINGKTYFYPFSHMPGTLVYNADLFKEAGLDEFLGGEKEIVTWTLEEYETILNTLKEKLPDVYPMALFAKNNQGDTWNLAWLRMYGSPFFGENNELVVNEEPGVLALTKLNDWYKAGLTNPGPESVTSNDCIGMFANQKIGVSFTNSVLFNGLLADMETEKTPKFDARLANIPGSEGPNTFTYVSGACIFDTGNEDRIAVAKDFIKFFSSDPELVIASKNGLPVRSSVAKEVAGEMPYMEAYNENDKYMFNFSNGVPGYTELRNVLFPEIQAVYIGSKEPKDALDSYVTQGNEIIRSSTASSEVYN